MGIGWQSSRLVVDRRVLRALVVLLAAAILSGHLLCGCRERANCNRQTDSRRCSPAGRPERCAEGNVWRSYAYVPCSLTREQCVVVPGGAFCRQPSDAAVALPPNPYVDASAPQE